MPQNRVSDTITHVTLTTINSVQHLNAKKIIFKVNEYGMHFELLLEFQYLVMLYYSKTCTCGNKSLLFGRSRVDKPIYVTCKQFFINIVQSVILKWFFTSWEIDITTFTKKTQLISKNWILHNYPMAIFSTSPYSWQM